MAFRLHNDALRWIINHITGQEDETGFLKEAGRHRRLAWPAAAAAAAALTGHEAADHPPTHRGLRTGGGGGAGGDIFHFLPRWTCKLNISFPSYQFSCIHSRARRSSKRRSKSYSASGELSSLSFIFLLLLLLLLWAFSLPLNSRASELSRRRRGRKEGRKDRRTREGANTTSPSGRLKWRGSRAPGARLSSCGVAGLLETDQRDGRMRLRQMHFPLSSGKQGTYCDITGFRYRLSK